ncbi:hypothetical protein L3Q82_004007 [Scortum barcoo]|uniref:Uncharacterized protein n=1 Tax=Scortum barcoo TaxID=214431 RepID=A0ACB8X6G9_9TELE|nr:hypothetical protein L3Q82_004007 [Scortum barcoo]
MLDRHRSCSLSQWFRFPGQMPEGFACLGKDFRDDVVRRLWDENLHQDSMVFWWVERSLVEPVKREWVVSVSQSKPDSDSSEAFLMASNITTITSQQSSSASFSLPISASAMGGIIILTLALVLGFPGNLFVAWSVLCRVKKRSVTCLLVLNLALADAFVLLSAPLFLRYLAGGRGWEFGSAACKLVHYLSSVNMYVSIYLICLMSMDRWLAVTRPFLSQRMRTKRSLLGSPAVGVDVSVHPVSADAFLPQSAKFQRRGQGSRLILLIIVAFTIFWLPYHIVNMIEDKVSVINAALAARPNVTAFAYFSSAVNPILYVFAGSSHIRQAGLSFMGRLFEATNSESRSSSVFTRSSRSNSSPDENSVLHTLSVKMGRPFKGKSKGRNSSVAARALKTH